MQLLTKTLRQQLPPLYATEALGDDALVVVKFFTPWTNWTWYATEYDPSDRLFFGLVEGFDVELGHFSLDELEALRGPGGLRIERDLYWRPQSLKAVRTRIETAACPECR